MSHFTKLDKAKVTDVDAFVAACADFGFTEVTRNVEIKDYAGRVEKVDVSVKTGRKYAVALKRNSEGSYDLIADWWGVRGELGQAACKKHGVTASSMEKADSEMVDAVLRHTTKHAIITKMRRQGWRAQVDEDESHNLNVRLMRA